MPIDMYDLWQKFCSSNNTFQGGFFRPERDFAQNVQTVSLAKWNEYTAQAEKNQEITDNLAPFTVRNQVIVSPGSGNFGIAKYPNGYGRYGSAGVLQHKNSCHCSPNFGLYNSDGVCQKEGRPETEQEKIKREEEYKAGIVEVPCIKIDNSRWRNCLTHETKCPTFEEPAHTQYGDGFHVSPRTVSVVIIDCYRLPTAPKFAYTIAPGVPQTGAGDYLIYDQNNSTPLEWPANMIPIFIDELQKIYSKYTRDAVLFQMNKAS